MAISLSVWLFTLSLPTLSSSAFIQHSRISTPRRVTVTSAVVGSKGHDSASGFTFDEIKSIESRLEIIEREAPDLLVAYYEPHLRSFSVKPGSTDQISVTSTCFALQSIYATGDCSALFANVVNANINMMYVNNVTSSSSASSSSVMIPIRDVVKSLLNASWRDEDMFQVPLLLYTILKVDTNRERSFLNIEDGKAVLDDERCLRVKRLINATIEGRPRRRSGISQPMSTYILYQTTCALAELVESTPPLAATGSSTDDEPTIGLGGLPISALPEGAASSTLLALTRCVEVSYNELCRQLAFRVAGDNSSFDIMRLAYSLLTYIKASKALDGTAGIEITPGAGAASGTTVKPPNRRLLQAALKAFFEGQRLDGMWDQGQPIYKSFRRTGRDVGNAYIYSADTVGSLLDLLPAEDFRAHLDGLRRLLSWIEEHRAVEIIPDYCDPVTGQCYGRPLRGWASPHMTSQSSSPVAWSTAQTVTCVMRLRKVIQRLLHMDVLDEFRGKANNGVPKLTSWDRLLDTDLGDPMTPEYRTLKDVINERMIQPFSDTISIAGSMCVPKVGCSYSAILFGPPGTAKTTICESLAERMGWDFVVIDTSNFLEDGLTNVASRIRYMFDRLRCLNNCVILFDEIEEFCLDRENPGLGMESRLLTTSMLTQLNDLRRAKKSIFFLATNRLRAFDSAIIRPGRFDMQLFVGTPNLESRVVQLRSQLASVPVSQSVKDDAEEAYRSYLGSVWSDDAMFFNYLEGVQFAAACCDVVAAGNLLTHERMSSILLAQAAVMTVRGTVREEYLASMSLSRL